MIYDSAKIMNAADRVNDLVLGVRHSKMRRQPMFYSELDVRALIHFLSIETCERFLNEVIDLPWVPWKAFNGLTTQQLAQVIGCSSAQIGLSGRMADGDRKRVTKSEVYGLTLEPDQSAYCCPDSVTFSNGTTIPLTASHFYLYNPRGVMYVMASILRYNACCRRIIKKVYDSVCTDEEWVIPSPAEVPSEPLTDSYEGTKQESSGVLMDSEQNPASDPKPLPIALPSPLESAVLQFLNTLKPGTKIQIVIPG